MLLAIPGAVTASPPKPPPLEVEAPLKVSAVVSPLGSR
jgi:hypothetical protein